MDLRRQGLTFESIGQRLGISKQLAYHHTKAALAEARETYKADAHEHIQLDLERCDAILEALAPTIADPRCADTILRVLERRAKLLGLDAPAKQDTTLRAELTNPFDLRSAIERDLKARLNGNANGANGTATSTLVLPANGVNGTNKGGGET